MCSSPSSTPGNDTIFKTWSKPGPLELILVFFLVFWFFSPHKLIIKLEQISPFLSTWIPLFQSHISSFLYCHSHTASSLWMSKATSTQTTPPPFFFSRALTHSPFLSAALCGGKVKALGFRSGLSYGLKPFTIWIWWTSYLYLLIFRFIYYVMQVVTSQIWWDNVLKTTSVRPGP